MIARGGAVKILCGVFRSPEEFLSRLDVGDSAGTGQLKVSTRARFSEGEALIVEVGFPGLPNRILVRGTALPVPAASDDSVVIQIAGGEEHKRDFLVAVAAGRVQTSWKRKGRRFPIRLPARFVVEGEEVQVHGDAQTDDMSAEGVFLKTERQIPEGSRVTVILDPCDGSAEMEFSGRVTYLRQGEGTGMGFGIQFDRLNSDEMKRLRRLIRDVKLSGKVVEWEDAAR